MKARHLVVAFSILVSPVAVAEPPAVEQCRQGALDAKEIYRQRSYDIEETKAFVQAGLERLAAVVQRCKRMALEEKDPESAAALMAEVTFVKDSYFLLSEDSDQSGRIENLMEGIEYIRGIIHDRAPATIPLLRKAGYLIYVDDPKRGHEMVELAVDIAREAYGEDDARYAEQLRYQAFLYAPSSKHGEEKRAFEDADEAERLYKEAVAVHIRAGSTGAVQELISTVNFLRRLYEATDREEDAQELVQYADTLYRERRKVRERAAEADAEAKEAEPADRPEEEGESE